MQKYRFSKANIPNLSIKERILLYMYHLDAEKGRDGNIENEFAKVKESLFLYSLSFIHSTDMVFFNVLKWDELDDIVVEHDDLPSIKLPRGYIGWARIPPGKKQSFRLALKKLINDKLVLTFIPYFRALKGFAGGKNIPQLSIWSAKNRDKLSEIAAISLTSNGFNKGKDLANKHKLLFPWQTHKLMIRDKSFVEFLTQQKLQ